MAKLTAKEVSNAKPQNKAYRLGDGGGLYLYIRRSGAKSWECRYNKPSTGKVTFTGIGSYPDLSLTDPEKGYRSSITQCHDYFAKII